jgi:serine/threonine protein phosphatase PrpC
MAADFNTDLSGSTVVAVFVYGEKIFCFNVGDSRAILLSCKEG